MTTSQPRAKVGHKISTKEDMDMLFHVASEMATANHDSIVPRELRNVSNVNRLGRLILAIHRRHFRERPMTDWQLIDTAPKDGSPILATNENYAYTLGRCVVVYWNTDPDAGEEGWMTPDDGDLDVRRTWLTHWMPLPPKPNERKEHD